MHPQSGDNYTLAEGMPVCEKYLGEDQRLGRAAELATAAMERRGHVCNVVR
jgi:hypothetical protein